MTSLEIIKKTIEFKNPERLAFDYYANGKHNSDIVTSYLDWDYDFATNTNRKYWIDKGREFYLDAFGNIWSRVCSDKFSKGEIYKGVLEESWNNLESFKMPNLSMAANNNRVITLFKKYKNHFKVGCLYAGAFEILRMLRGFKNLMEDFYLEASRVKVLIEIITNELIEAVKVYAKCGANGIHIMEDWGTQQSTIISRSLWEDFFASVYQKICMIARNNDMKVILHSCGMIDQLIDILIDVGIDVLQFDQNSIYSDSGKNNGIEKLKKKYGGRVSFFCPVDIQKTLITGDKKKIEAEVKKLVLFLGSRQGGFIAKAYGRGKKEYLDAIDCREDWNNYAFDCFKKYGEKLFGKSFDIPVVEYS